MSLTVFEGLQSEIFVPITPKSVFTPVKKELKEMRIALATAAGVHLKVIHALIWQETQRIVRFQMEYQVKI